MARDEGDTVAGDPDPAARFEALYKEMLPPVHRFAAARLGAADAEDVASEVFHAAAVAFTDGRRATVTPAWIMAVTKNKIVDRWRTAERRSAIRLRHRVGHDEAVDFPPDWTADPRREDVLDALDRLRPSDRSLLVLHYLDGLSAPVLAEALGISVRAVESRVVRARKAFRRAYRPGGES